MFIKNCLHRFVENSKPLITIHSPYNTTENHEKNKRSSIGHFQGENELNGCEDVNENIYGDKHDDKHDYKHGDSKHDDKHGDFKDIKPNKDHLNSYKKNIKCESNSIGEYIEVGKVGNMTFII